MECQVRTSLWETGNSTHVQFVQLSLNTVMISSWAAEVTRQQGLGDGINDSMVGRMKGNGELGIVEFASLAIFLVEDILCSKSKGCRLTCLEKLVQHLGLRVGNGELDGECIGRLIGDIAAEGNWGDG